MRSSDDRGNTCNARKASGCCRWRTVLIALGAMAVLLGVVAYGFFVFAAGATREAWEWPKLTAAEELRCRKAFKENSLTPYGSVQFPMYREYSSPFLGESAKTIMYRSELLDNPDCAALRLQSAARHHNPLIIVFYDVTAEQAVLVVRNFDRSQSEAVLRRRP